MYYFLCFSEMNRQKHIWWMWCFRKKPSTHTHLQTRTHTHTHGAPQLDLHNVSAHITIFHIKTHTPVNISDDHLLLPHINTPTITILVCFMPLLCSLSQILQYLCVQQYFNKEYQNWYMQDLVFFFAFREDYSCWCIKVLLLNMLWKHKNNTKVNMWVI